ncbi:MAG: hypothetical protein LAO31_01575 [Acidobacteriia bacterium]|nr:hypothetical protein [Terriglobia bacterium]
MLPDDDMLKAFVADTIMKEEEQASLNTPAPPGKGLERGPDAETLKPAEKNPSSRQRGAKPVFGSILKWGLLILLVTFVWFVLTR